MQAELRLPGTSTPDAQSAVLLCAGRDVLGYGRSSTEGGTAIRGLRDGGERMTAEPGEKGAQADDLSTQQKEGR